MPEFDVDIEGDEKEADLIGVSPALVARAKRDELLQLADMKTLDVVHRNDVDFANHVVIGTRWVVVNKGNALQPRVKARLVAKEFRTKHGCDELFSGTPGLSGVRYVISDLATNNRGRIAMVADVKGAFLYGVLSRDVLVKLPPEYGVDANYFGKLHKSLYGLRDAP